MPVLPFKNDGSFLEKFRQMQQQNTISPSYPSLTSNVQQNDYSFPPPVDVTVPPPVTMHPSQPSQYFLQHLPPPPPPQQQQQLYNDDSSLVKIKEEMKRENRSPSPYSPSRPCEDEEDLVFYNKGECSTCTLEREQKCWTGITSPEQYSWVS